MPIYSSTLPHEDLDLSDVSAYLPDEGTVLETFSQKKRQYNYYQTRDPFPPSSRPLWLIDCGANIKYGCSESAYKIWAGWHDTFLKSRSKYNRAGILMTNSYRNAQYLADLCDYSHMIITHGDIRRKSGEESLNFKKLPDALDLYKQCARDKVPVAIASPVLTTGYDFPHELCRFVVISKAPYPNTATKLAKVKQKLNKYWIPNKVAITLQQQAGRGMRDEKDWCEVIIIDSTIGQYLTGSSSRWLLPNSFEIKRCREILPPVINPFNKG